MRLFVALIVALLFLGSCSSQPEQSADIPVTAGLPNLPGLGLLPKGTSDAGTVLERYGAQYIPTLNNRVTAAGALGNYAPAVTPSGTLAEVAYGGYQFDGTGLSGPAWLDVSWHAGVAPADGYVGLSNWVTGNWEWREVIPGVESIALADIADYINATDGRLFCVVVVNGVDPADLASVRFRFSAPAPYWHLTQLSATPGPVHHVKLFELQGNPAVVYWRDGRTEVPPTSRIVLKRALDPDGELWGPPQVVTEVPLAAPHGSPNVGAVWALVIDGNLTVYYEAPLEDNDGVQIRAIDPEASAFYLPEFVYQDPDIHSANKLMIVDGRAAFFSVTLSDSISEFAVAWDHAVDAAGSDWNSGRLTPDNWASHIKDSLVTGSGIPAMFSVDEWDHNGEIEDPPPGSEGVFMRYRRALGSNPALAGWRSPVDLFHNNPPWFLNALTLADGRPAFLYALTGTFAWQAALDTEGDSWPIVGMVVPGLEGAARIEMELIGGLPALVYTETTPESLYFRPAADALGTAWEDPQTVYAGIVTESLRLTEFGGRPAIATQLPATAESSYPAFFIYR